MKPMSLGVAFFSLLIVSSVWSADVVPKRSDFSHYQPMLDHSPFAVATAAALPAATPNFAKDLYVANAAHSIPDGDMVTVASISDKNFKEYLTTKGPNEHGYAIASIEWSDRVGATKVTISKDGQFATLNFNQALISQAPAPAAAPQPVTPYQPGLPAATPVTRPAVPAVPGVPTPPPRVRGVIPRNPNAATPAQMTTPPPAEE